MVNFSKTSQQNNLDQSMKPENDLKTTSGSDIVTAEYSYFHIHQIKAWSGWSVNQEEIDYTVDSPVYLNA
jgi:hypothetical protein